MSSMIFLTRMASAVPKYLLMALMTPVSEAMTGWMDSPVRKRMSSMISRSVGSTMAKVRKDRIR